MKACGQKLSIVVPVYNEGANFSALYHAIEAHIQTPHVIFVVYDFDEDDTLPVARTFASTDPNLCLVKNELGKGVVNAIKVGFQNALEGPCLVVMADLSDDLSIVDEMVALFDQGYKVVCGSRYMKGGKQLGGPILKRIMSRIAGLSLFYLRRFPTHDATNNFKLYDKELLSRMRIESQGGFEIALEITVKAFKMGAKITEVPTTWSDRTSGDSKFRLWQWLPSYLRWYLKAWF